MFEFVRSTPWVLPAITFLGIAILFLSIGFLRQKDKQLKKNARLGEVRAILETYFWGPDPEGIDPKVAARQVMDLMDDSGPVSGGHYLFAVAIANSLMNQFPCHDRQEMDNKVLRQNVEAFLQWYAENRL